MSGIDGPYVFGPDDYGDFTLEYSCGCSQRFPIYEDTTLDDLAKHLRRATGEQRNTLFYSIGHRDFELVCNLDDDTVWRRFWNGNRYSKWKRLDLDTLLSDVGIESDSVANVKNRKRGYHHHR